MIGTRAMTGFAGTAFPIRALTGFDAAVGTLQDAVVDIFVAGLAGFGADVFESLDSRGIVRESWFRDYWRRGLVLRKSQAGKSETGEKNERGRSLNIEHAPV
jgi:hypothetical protein